MDMVFSEELLGFDDEAVAQQSKQHWGKQTLLAAIHHFLTTAATFMFPLAFQSRKKVKAVFVFFPQWLPPPNTNKDILHMLAKTLFSFKVAAVLSKSPLLSKLPFFAAFCSFSLIQKRSDYQKKVRQRPLFKIVFFCFLNLKENLDMVLSLIISFIHLGIPRRRIMINRFLNCLRPQEKKPSLQLIITLCYTLICLPSILPKGPQQETRSWRVYVSQGLLDNNHRIIYASLTVEHISFDQTPL